MAWLKEEIDNDSKIIHSVSKRLNKDSNASTETRMHVKTSTDSSGEGVAAVEEFKDGLGATLASR